MTSYIGFLIIMMILQPHLPLSGETGAAGPSAFPLVVRGGKLEPGLAAKQPWEVLSSALEILRRMNIAAQPIAQVKTITLTGLNCTN